MSGLSILFRFFSVITLSKGFAIESVYANLIEANYHTPCHPKLTCDKSLNFPKRLPNMSFSASFFQTFLNPIFVFKEVLCQFFKMFQKLLLLSGIFSKDLSSFLKIVTSPEIPLIIVTGIARSAPPVKLERTSLPTKFFNFFL